jgi:hypothetical protein
MPKRAEPWRPTTTKSVEFYVRSAEESSKAFALGSTYMSGSEREHSWAGTLTCRICGRVMIDLPPIEQPEGGWPDVVLLICDEGFHRLHES